MSKIKNFVNTIKSDPNAVGQKIGSVSTKAVVKTLGFGFNCTKYATKGVIGFGKGIVDGVKAEIPHKVEETKELPVGNDHVTLDQIKSGQLTKKDLASLKDRYLMRQMEDKNDKVCKQLIAAIEEQLA